MIDGVCDASNVYCISVRKRSIHHFLLSRHNINLKKNISQTHNPMAIRKQESQCFVSTCNEHGVGKNSLHNFLYF